MSASTQCVNICLQPASAAVATPNYFHMLSHTHDSRGLSHGGENEIVAPRTASTVSSAAAPHCITVTLSQILE